MKNIELKSKSSVQFKQVADFIDNICINTAKGWISPDFAFLCIDPWTDETLTPNVCNIHTNAFCALIPAMKVTSCERHLRRYKALHAAQLKD